MAVPTNLRAQFGRRLRQLRRQCDLTLDELGERAKVSGKFVQSIETGRQSPTIDTVDKLARGLNVAIHELLVVDERTPAALRARARELISEAPDTEIGRIVRVLEAAMH